MNQLVTVIVPNHLNENYEYLRWCLKAILSSRGVDLEIICISDAEFPTFSYPCGDKIKFIWDKTLDTATKKWNHGLSISNPASKHVMLISDDVMVTQDTIAEMVRCIGDQRVIIGPASNCDATTRFFTKFYVRGVEIPQKTTLDEMAEQLDAVIEMPLRYPILIDPGWISFYCTLFPRTVLDEVGDLDEKLDCRHGDVDYCQRARALGIPSLIHLGAFALHFGDRTLPQSTTPEQYKAADQAYHEKYHPMNHHSDDGDLL